MKRKVLYAMALPGILLDNLRYERYTSFLKLAGGDHF
jgi:hypothetical protein